MRNHKPLIDLHRHLDGNLRLQTMIDIAKRCGLDLPGWTVDQLRPHAQIQGQEADLIGFLEKFDLIQGVLADYEAVRQIARENVLDAKREQIDYIELRFSPYFMSQRFGLDIQRVVECICDEVNTTKASAGIEVKLIVIMCRNLGLDNCYRELDAAIKFREQGVIAIDLAGDEKNFPGSLFVDHFKKARDAGLRITVHAGEADGAQSVKQAIEELGAERIGHGVRAMDDHKVVDLLVERRIPLEICPTSNVQTSAVSSLKTHPLRGFFDRGVMVTVNTDDPGVSGIDLAHEYELLGSEMGFSATEIELIQHNAYKAKFGVCDLNWS